MSRIVEAKLQVLRAKTGDGVAMSFAPLTHRAIVLVELRTADGVVGHGESWVNYPPWAHVERAATLREGVFPLLFDQDAADIAGLQAQLRAKLEPLGRQWGARGPIMQAISAVDVALWDRAGKAAGLAVSRLAGTRVREQAPVYASSLGPLEVTAQAQVCARQGFSAAKVKLGFDRAQDERILAEARAVLGEDATLYADANQAWTVEEAVAMAPVLERFDVGFIEEPVRGNKIGDLERLHERTGIRIATGENVYGHEDFVEYAESPAVAVLQPDIAKTGGMTECLAIGELAKANGKAVMPHLYGGAIAFAATLQYAAHNEPVTAIEYDIRENPLRDPLLHHPPSATHGRIPLPDAPGLGVTLDERTVAEHVLSTATTSGGHLS